MSALSMDDFTLKVVLEPRTLTDSITLANIEQLLKQDAEAVTWAFTKALKGAENAA